MIGAILYIAALLFVVVIGPAGLTFIVADFLDLGRSGTFVLGVAFGLVGGAISTRFVNCPA
jgi:hypothetical protein